MSSVDLGSAHGKVEIDVSDVGAAASQASRDIEGIGKSAEKASGGLQMVSASITAAVPGSKMLLGAVIATGVGMGYFGKMAWDQVSGVQQATLALRAYEKDGKKVDRVLKGLLSYARSDMGVLFNRKDLFAAAQGLKVMGDDTSNLTDHVKIMSRSVGLGLSTWGDLSQIVGRVGSTSRLTGDDFDSLTKAGYKLDPALRNTDVSFKSLFNAMDKGIPVDAMKGQAEAIVGIGVRLQTAFRGVGEAILGIDKDTGKFIKGGAGQKLNDFLKGLPDLLKAAQKGMKENKKYIWIVAGAIVGGLVPAFYALAASVIAATLPLLPFLTLGAAIGAVAYLIYRNWDIIGPVFERVKSAMWKALPALNFLINGLQRLSEWLMKQPGWVRSVVSAFFILIGILLAATGSAMLFAGSVGMVNKGLAAMIVKSGIAASAVRLLSMALRRLFLIGIIVTLMTAAWKAGEWLVTTFKNIGYAIAGSLGPIATLGAWWTRYGDTIKELIGIEAEHAKGSKKNAADIKAAEDIKKAAKLAAKTQADEAAKAEQAQLESEQLTAIARAALYVKDKAALESLTAAIQDSSKEQIKAFDEAQKKLYEWVGIFEEVPEKLEITGQELLKRLQEQVQMFDEWKANINAISSKIPDELEAELMKMGPKAAGQIQALKNMSDEELVKYVELWEQRTAQAMLATEEILRAGATKAKEAGGKVGQASVDGVTEKVENGKDAIRKAASGTAGVLDEKGLKDTASKGGSSIGSSWGSSIESAIWQSLGPIGAAIGAVKNMLGGSLPEIGPLANGVPEKGGSSIAKAWMQGINDVIASTALNLAPIQMALATPAPSPQPIISPNVTVQMPLAARAGNSYSVHVDAQKAVVDEQDIASYLRRMVLLHG